MVSFGHIPADDFRYCPECDGSAATDHEPDCSVEVITVEVAQRTDEGLDAFLNSGQMTAFVESWARRMESLHRFAELSLTR